MSTFPDDMTLAEARILLVKMAEKGVDCPCCFQFAKIYPRVVTSTMTKDLIAMSRKHRRQWFHLSTSMDGKHPGDFAKLRYWGLVEEEPSTRADGGRAGWWRVTDLGESWIAGFVTIPRHAEIYDGECLQLFGDPTKIQQALGTKFDLAELLSA